MPTAILTTKLYIPTLRNEWILRPRLLERLNQGLRQKLVLVSAPAGFGKSTLLGSWIHEQNLSVAWLSLDADDSDFSRFMQYFVAALQTILPTSGETILEMLHSPYMPSVEAVMTTLVNEIATIQEDFIFVLDDYHVIDSTTIDQALTFLIEHLPPQMHMVISTREDPQLPLARLRVRGQLTEVRVADLRFTVDEIADLLNRTLGLDLSVKDVQALEQRTEGWIAGLQLVAIALQTTRSNTDSADVATFIQDFTGSHRFVLDYLLEEVLERQPDDVRRFLIQTSILDQFNASLCDAVTNRDDSRHMLETLEKSNLFIIPLDNQRQWYRYHHLFADALRTHLYNEYIDEVIAFHVRACEWYWQYKFTAFAIHHAFAAEDVVRAANIIEHIWPEMDENYQSPLWLKWAEALPETVVSTRPVLNLGFAWALLSRGDLDLAEAHLQRAEQWIQANPDEFSEQMVVMDEEYFLTLPAVIASARAYRELSFMNTARAVEHAEQSLALAPNPEHSSHRQARALLGLAHCANGDLLVADEALEAFMLDMLQANNLPDVFGIAFILVDIRKTLGQIQKSFKMLERIQGVIKNQGEKLAIGTSDIYRCMAALYLEINDLQAMHDQLHLAEKIGEQIGLPNWEHRLYLTKATIEAALGDLDTALEYIDYAEENHTTTPLPVPQPFSALRARIWIRQNKIDLGLAWANQHDLTIDGDLSYLREFEYITLARLLLLQYQTSASETYFEQVIYLLDRLYADAKSHSRNGSMLEILLLQALAYQQNNDLPAALGVLKQALALAQPEGYIRVFVDEGSTMAQLLHAAQAADIVPHYVRQILAAFPDVSVEPKKPSTQDNLIEALSEREQDVLHYLATELTGPEIARELMISLNTMRTHTKNIYAKLGVNSRRSAVRKSQELNLI